MATARIYDGAGHYLKHYRRMHDALGWCMDLIGRSLADERVGGNWQINVNSDGQTCIIEIDRQLTYRIEFS